jgi:hypothetical protein
MSIVLDGATQYLHHAAAVVTTYPFAISAWLYDSPGPTAGALVSIGTSGSNNNRWTMRTSGATRKGQFNARISSDDIINSNSAYTLGAWTNVIIFAVNNSSRSVYVNNGSGATTGNQVKVTGVNSTYIGAVNDGSIKWNGYIAEVGIWQASLGAASRLALQTKSPELVQLDDLVAYWPLGGSKYGDDANDRKSTYHMTEVGSPSYDAEHPTLDYAVVSILDPIGINWQPVWKPVWKPVWRQEEPVVVPSGDAETQPKFSVGVGVGL